MAELHIHTVHQKRNPLTARLQSRQCEFGKTLQNTLQTMLVSWIISKKGWDNVRASMRL